MFYVEAFTERQTTTAKGNFFTQQHGDNQLWEIQGQTQNSPKKGKKEK